MPELRTASQAQISSWRHVQPSFSASLNLPPPVREGALFGGQEGIKTPPCKRKIEGEIAKKACKPVEQEENH
jgi:hypothetical protein